ncbi:MAG TPA: hypothetical protein VGO11_13280 [Chthoniobacteraceae bacterium]|jgi:hypothetical protein|nr:hypothetical protein [Chthoniobacteraceae bacterium]
MRLFLLLALAAGSLYAAEPSPIAIKGTRLTFDPKTATPPAKGGFGWGNGSVVVTILPRHDNQCRFDYQWEIEGAGSYVIHRVAVPLDSGPVVIDAAQHADPEHGWSGVYTSFTERQARLYRRATHDWLIDPLEGTPESVSHRPLRAGDADRPLQPDDRVQVRCVLYLEYAGQFQNRAPDKVQPKPFTVPLTGDTPWKWIQHLLQEMKLYELREVWVPSIIAGPARNWLPGYTDGDRQEVFVEIQALAIEPK